MDFYACPIREGSLSVNLASCLEHQEFQGLLSKARSEPAVEYPRMVCADWLEARGMAEPARRWRASMGSPFSRTPLPASFTHPVDLQAPVIWRVAEGFLHAEAMDMAEWSHAGIWRPWPRVTRDWVDRVQRLASERRIAGLDLSRLLERLALPELLAEMPEHAAGHLWLDGNGLLDAQVEMLATCRRLGSLRSLRLGHNRLTPKAATYLLAAPWARNLVSLDLEGNDRFGVQGAQLIGRAYSFGHLKRLHLAGCGVGDDGLFGIAEAQSQWPMEELDLRSNGITAAGARGGDAVGSKVEFLHRPLGLSLGDAEKPVVTHPASGQMQSFEVAKGIGAADQLRALDAKPVVSFQVERNQVPGPRSGQQIGRRLGCQTVVPEAQ